MAELRDYVAFATSLAYQAGERMRVGQEQVRVTVKEDNTPVTEVDTAINELVISEVQKTFPAHGVYGEEASYQIDAEWLWVCDPIDGTVAFITRMPLSAFSLALVHNGEPVVGVIYNPWTDELFSAAKGEGATRNGKPISVSVRGKEPTNRRVVIAASAQMRRNRLFGSEKAAELIQQKDWRLLSCHGIACRGYLVAEGGIDGAVYTHTGAHDIAAVHVIVTEAGGVVTDITGKPQRYDQPINGAIITNGHIHDELVAMVAELQR